MVLMSEKYGLVSHGTIRRPRLGLGCLLVSVIEAFCVGIYEERFGFLIVVPPPSRLGLHTRTIINKNDHYDTHTYFYGSYDSIAYCTYKSVHHGDGNLTLFGPQDFSQDTRHSMHVLYF